MAWRAARATRIGRFAGQLLGERKHSLQPGAPFADRPAAQPVSPKRRAEPQPQREIASRARPLQNRSQIGILANQLRHGCDLLAVPSFYRRLRQACIVGSVRPLQPSTRTLRPNSFRLQPRQRIIPNRFQQNKTRSPAGTNLFARPIGGAAGLGWPIYLRADLPDQRLVDQCRQQRRREYKRQPRVGAGCMLFPEQHADALYRCAGGVGQPVHVKQPLVLQVQPRLRSDEYPHLGSLFGDRGNQVCPFQQVLQAVKDQQDLPGS